MCHIFMQTWSESHASLCAGRWKQDIHPSIYSFASCIKKKKKTVYILFHFSGPKCDGSEITWRKHKQVHFHPLIQHGSGKLQFYAEEMECAWMSQKWHLSRSAPVQQRIGSQIPRWTETAHGPKETKPSSLHSLILFNSVFCLLSMYGVGVQTLGGRG